MRVRSVYSRAFSIAIAGAPRELLGELDVGVLEQAAALGAASVSVPNVRPRAVSGAMITERRPSRRTSVELVGVASAGDEHLVGDLADERGLAAAHDAPAVPVGASGSGGKRR